MTNQQAWAWVERHVCSIETDPQYIFMAYNGDLFESKNKDVGMRIIECVQQAIEFDTKVQP